MKKFTRKPFMIIYDIVTALFVILITTGLFLLRNYKNSGRMYEGEYIYNGEDKEIILNVDYDEESDNLLIDMKYIEKDYYAGDTKGLSIAYNPGASFCAFEDMTVNPGRLNERLSGDMPEGGAEQHMVTYADKYLSFSGYGAILFLKYEMTGYVNRAYYLYKNGPLSLMMVEIIQNALIAAEVILLTVYGVVCIRRKKAARAVAVIGICLTMGILTAFLVPRDICGEYVNEDETVIINRIEDEDQLLWRSKSKNGNHEEELQDPSDLSTEDYKETTHIPLNGRYNLLYSVPFILCTIFTVPLLKHKKDAPEVPLKLPYGVYVADRLLYLCDVMKGMEQYFEENVMGGRVEIREYSCNVLDEKAESVRYTIKAAESSMYPGLNLKHMKAVDITAADGTELKYEFAYGKKNFLLVHKLQGVPMAVYSLKSTSE
ncbi:MAG: hypothetical protein ACI4EN_10490 [Butyrivibrio sp.]